MKRQAVAHTKQGAGTACKSGKTDKNPSLLFSTPEKPTKSFYLSIEHCESGKVIGVIWAYLIENDRKAKVAYRISEKYKGNGYAPKYSRLW